MNHTKYLKIQTIQGKPLFLTLLLLIVAVFLEACQSDNVTYYDTQETASAIPEKVVTIVSSTESPPAFLESPSTQTSETPVPALSDLTVSSNLPDALVFINEVQVGHTPYLTNLPTGEYSIMVTLPGFRPWQQQVTLQENQPLSLLAEFKFAPYIEQLLDICLDHFWWAEGSKDVYYVKCRHGSFYLTEQRHEEGPIWRLDLATGESIQVEDAWPPDWVPRRYQSLVPNSLPPWLISVSPSGQRVLYLEEMELDPIIPTATSSSAPQDLGLEPFLPVYNVHVVLDDGSVLDLGVLDALPDTMTWSRDEDIIFIPSHAFSAHIHDGWLIDLQQMTIEPLEIPESIGLHSTDFFNASILPNGEAILYKPNLSETEPYRIWHLETNKEQVLKEPHGISFGWYRWLSDDRYLIFIGGQESSIIGLFWYDLYTSQAVLIQGHEQLPKMEPNRLSLSPQRDKMIFRQYDSSGGIRNGLWLLTFDTD